MSDGEAFAIPAELQAVSEFRQCPVPLTRKSRMSVTRQGRLETGS